LDKLSLIYRYWGKAAQQGEGYHLLPYHCLDVAAVGQRLLESHNPILRSLTRLTGLEEPDLIRWTVFFLALHDLGKFAVSFQQLRPDLLKDLQQRKTDKQYTERHDSLGYAVWQKQLKAYFQTRGLLHKTSRRSGLQAADYWMMAVTGHHGQPPRHCNDLLIGDHFESPDQNAICSFVDALVELLLGDLASFPAIPVATMKKASWWLAGFSVLCDWLGSNADYFSYCSRPIALPDYWQRTLRQADKALAATELLPAEPSNSLTLAQLIPVEQGSATAEGIRTKAMASAPTATPLQSLVTQLELADGPQFFILEDVTGAGKTEAALLLAHRLMANGKASGIYFGLPTMATANGMYERLGKVYRQLYADRTRPSLVLAHGARDLSENFRQSLLPVPRRIESLYDTDDAPPAAIHCAQWLGDSRKKALLAEMGVGTIDQALLGVLPSRHQSLRLLGLMNKVLLVDEVHACDAYMHPLLCSLLKAHAMAGGSAILLSATLPRKQRQALADAFTDGLQTERTVLKETGYPLLTRVDGVSVDELLMGTRPSVRREVGVSFTDSIRSVEDELASVVAAGQCACWIRNTVADAREAYVRLKQQYPEWEIDLFHARFALVDRLSIEQRVLERFGRRSGGNDRKGQILIATQVVEQSLDLDFDRIITDLAPIDLIIQRAGRLHRHSRDALGNCIEGEDQRGKPVLTIHAPAWQDAPTAGWFRDFFPRVQKVYDDHGQLWLSMKLLHAQRGIRMPDDARTLIEGVYGDDADIPEGLMQASNEAQGGNRSKASIACLNALKLDSGYSREDANNWWDEAITPTRLGEEMNTLWLARWEKGELKSWNNEAAYAWQQSSLSVRAALISQIAPPDDILQEQIDACLESLPAKGQWGVLLPLVQLQADLWQGLAQDINGLTTTFYYSPQQGLMTAKEHHEMEGNTA